MIFVLLAGGKNFDDIAGSPEMRASFEEWKEYLLSVGVPAAVVFQYEQERNRIWAIAPELEAQGKSSRIFLKTD